MDARTTPTSPPPDILWQQLADHMVQLVWIADGQGRPFWFNRRVVDYSGLALEELCGDGWHAIIHPDDLPRVAESWNAAVAGGRSYESIYLLRRADWRYRRFLARAEPFRDPAGTITHWFGTNTDVSDQLSAEQRREFRLQLQEALRSAATAEDGKLRAAELLGKALGASRVLFAEIDTATHEARVGEEYRAPGVPSIAGTHPISPAIFARYADGAPLVTPDFRADPALSEGLAPEVGALPFRAVLDVPLLRDGGVVGVLAVHDLAVRHWSEEEVALALLTAERSWDTVERARAEKQLRFSEAQFRTTAEAVPGLLFVTDTVGRSTYVNQFYKDYTGRQADSDGYWWREVIHPDDREAFFAETVRARRDENDFRLDYRIRRADGAFRWHSTKATPTRDPDGTIVRWVGVSLDIHDRREAEDRARAAAEEVEAIYASAPVGLTVLDQDLRYVRINDRLAEINGLPAAEHLGRTVRDVIPDLADSTLR